MNRGGCKNPLKFSAVHVNPWMHALIDGGSNLYDGIAVVGESSNPDRELFAMNPLRDAK